jgi:hypothetical protein
MLVAQKIDWHFQFWLGVIMIISIPFLFLYGFGFGLLILGAWQLISASVNTRSFLQNAMKKEIRNYWIFSIIDLIIFFCPFFLDGLFDQDDLEVLTWAGATCGLPIAVYYIWIYKKLLQSEENTKELNGFIKHNLFK